MKVLASFATLAAISIASAGISFADTLTLASYGSTATAPSGTSNTATLFNGGTSYSVPTGGVWTSPVGISSWVSNSANDYPGGGSYVPDGNYAFTSTFTDLTPGTSSGTVTVMADDSTSIFLNGVQIAAAAGATPATNCTASTPNCVTPVTYNLIGFLAGTNTLTFVVTQDFDNAMGLDYQATVNTVTTTPEPSSLLLLSTGLMGVAGVMRKRLA